jgi:murein L,D-transpeptidase YcbB/YkuD
MRVKISLIALATLFFAGCQGPSFGGGSSGSWSSAQKEEFINILNEDRYSSVCDLQPMINQYKQTKDDKILTKLLYRYSENLANSCIDIPAFKSALRAHNDKAVYEIYEEYVSSSDISAKLKSGASVDSILQAYAPETPQFQALINAYNSAASPIEQYKIKLNIERTKLFKPGNWSGTYIVVNVPEFKFRLFENGAKSLEFNVITGRPSWPTPIFASMMKYITVNPTWNVPDNIARKEEIPKIIKDKSYLRRHNMVVKKDYGLDSPEVDPSTVNWKEYLKPEWATKDLPYKIIEKSSKRNALGVVKFIFPNRHSVYMHDTPNKRLFSRQVRAFSHGCIRLEKPLKLLGHISSYYTTKNFDEVGNILKAKKTKYVNLAQKIPVNIVYLTRYVDDGMLIYGQDIYGYDKITKLKIPTTMVDTSNK